MHGRHHGLGAFLGCICVFAATTEAKSKSKARPPKSSYQVTNLVSDGSVSAAHTDPNLVNGWGVAFNPQGFVWVSAAETGVSTLYDGQGNPQTLVVTIPALPGSEEPAHPTGIAFYGGPNFVVTKGAASGPSRFIFATEDGTIAGWNPTADGTHAIQVVDNSDQGAIYKGLALGNNGSGELLFATDFHNAKVDVFDGIFNPVTTTGGFVDPRMRQGFAPFGIANIAGALFVTYAMQDADAKDDVAGSGLGFVDEFDLDGNLIRRFASRGYLNAPWGMALAPSNFGQFSNALLIGNFGNGWVNAFDPVSGRFIGLLHDVDRRPIAIDGLWGIQFGNGLNQQPTNTLFFAAGPNDEAGGLYGRIDVAPN